MSSEFYLPRTLQSKDKTYDETALLAASRFVIVLAEPGAGKTFLMESLARRLNATVITANRFAHSGKLVSSANCHKLPAGEPHLEVSVETLAIRSAISGRGIALVNEVFVRDEIRQGRLINLLPETGQFTLPFCHYLVWRQGEQKKAVQDFLTWSLEFLGKHQSVEALLRKEWHPV